MKTIPLTRGFVALVDDQDYERLSAFKWRVLLRDDIAYAVRSSPRPNSRTLYMHREIVGGAEVDHRRHDVAARIVDNQRSNLREARHCQNQANQRKQRGGRTSIFKGVGRKRDKWRAYIERDGLQRHLGHFFNEGYAALLYDLAAVAASGPFALTNFPVPGSSNWIYGDRPPTFTDADTDRAARRIFDHRSILDGTDRKEP